MRLLFIGAGNPIPTFISRRILGLSRSFVEVVVALSYAQKHELPSTVKVVRYGEKLKARDFVILCISILSNPIKFAFVYQRFKGKGFGTRARLTVRYFPLALIPKVDLIHVQWVAAVPNLHWLKAMHGAPIVATARGSQVTVYPYTRPGYADVIRQSLHLVDACHLVSNDLRPAVRRLGADEKKLFVNYNGIDLNSFQPNRQRASGDKTIRLISVGALIWRKGYVFQMSVLQQLWARDMRASLTIVGEGADRDGLRYMVKALGLQDHVKFTGQLTESEIIEHLTNSDIYLSTSFAEGLPNSVVEAAACGLPVIAFACEGIREVVEHGVSGYVVDPGKVDMMVNYLETLQDETIRNAMGKHARQRMVELFDQNRCVAEMITHYQRVMNA